MNNTDKQYLDLLRRIIEEGHEQDTRAGKTRSLFGTTMSFDISNGKIPLLTTKKVFAKGIIHELLWFLSGSTNIKYLVENGVHIWDDDAYRYYMSEIHPNVWGEKISSKEEFLQAVLEDKKLTYQKNEIKVSNRGLQRLPLCAYIAGELGPVYGKQWRKFGNHKPFDQIAYIIDKLKNNSDDRRIILDAWNPNDLEGMALPPCHILYQFSTRKLTHEEKEKYGKERALSCCFFMRSNDFTNGNPFNIAQVAMLTHVFAHVCNMTTDKLVYFGGDTHVYVNNIEQAKLQLERKGSDIYPTLRLTCPNDIPIDKIKYDDFVIENYYPDEAIKYNLNTGTPSKP